MTSRDLGYRMSTVAPRRAVIAKTLPSRVTTTRGRLTASWAAAVSLLEAAVAGFPQEALGTNRCRIDFFEIASDEQLHVNVTHTHRTRTPPGWNGPGTVAEGFVHNRRFADTPLRRIVQDIRAMVLAARCSSPLQHR